MILIGVLVSGWFASGRRSQPSDYRSFEEIVAPSLSQGFEILVSPDLPGPYRWLDTRVLAGGAQGRVTAGGNTRTYTLPDEPNREYLAVYLATRDDQPTYAVLFRDRPDPDSLPDPHSLEEEKKKLEERLEKQGP